MENIIDKGARENLIIASVISAGNGPPNSSTLNDRIRFAACCKRISKLLILYKEGGYLVEF